MPDLGPYAVEVLLAYGGSFVLLSGIVMLSLRRWRRFRDEMARVERGPGA